jgi:hypothetical protein
MHCSIGGCFPLPASSTLFSFQQTIFYSMSFKCLFSIQCTSSDFTIKIWNTISTLALPPDPLKNLPPKLFYFAFETKKKLIKKIGIAPEFRSCPQRLFRAFFISNLDRKIAWCTLYWEQTFKRHRIENGK